jgi:hypothetical protein
VLHFLYLFHHNCFIVTRSGEQIDLDTSDAGSSGCNSLEMLTLSGSLVRPITFLYLPLITFV